MAKQKINKTNVARLLDAAKVDYELIPYEVDESDLSAVHVAAQLGEDVERVFKTIVLHGEKSGYFVCVVPGEHEIDLKKAAKVSGNKKCELLPMKELLPVTFSHRDEETFPHLCPPERGGFRLHLRERRPAGTAGEARPRRPFARGAGGVCRADSVGIVRPRLCFLGGALRFLLPLAVRGLRFVCRGRLAVRRLAAGRPARCLFFRVKGRDGLPHEAVAGATLESRRGDLFQARRQAAALQLAATREG